MSDVMSTGNIRPRTSSTQPATKSRRNNVVSTRISRTQSHIPTVRLTGRTNSKMNQLSTQALRPKTSPDVLMVKVEPVNSTVGGQPMRKNQDILYHAEGIPSEAVASTAQRSSSKKAKEIKSTRKVRNVKYTRTECTKRPTAVTFQENLISSNEKPALRNVQSCEDVSAKYARTEDPKKRAVDMEKCISSGDKPLIRNVQSCEDVFELGRRRIGEDFSHSKGTFSSMNTRYSSGIKMRIAKLFGGKNVEAMKDNHEQTDSGFSNQSRNCSSTGTTNSTRATRYVEFLEKSFWTTV